MQQFKAKLPLMVAQRLHPEYGDITDDCYSVLSPVSAFFPLG
jgi:hypothetical protein